MSSSDTHSSEGIRQRLDSEPFSLRQHDSTFEDRRYLLMLALIAVVVFWKLFLTREYSMLTYPDSASQSYPWYQYIATTLRQRSFPFWDPFVEAGKSFIGEIQSGAFYPLNWLVALAPRKTTGVIPAAAIEWLAVLHCFLASLWTYLLARHFRLSRFSSLIAGLVFGYSGSVAVRSFGQINLLNASAWIPGVFLFYFMSLESLTGRRRLLYAGLSGLCLGISMLAGHHQPFIYAGIAVVLAGTFVCLIRRSVILNDVRSSDTAILVSTVVVLAFALAFSLLQVVPALEYSRYSYRWVSETQPLLGSARVPYSVAGNRWSLSPQALIDTVFPYVASAENNPYFGILPLLFALFSFTGWRKDPPIRLWWLLAAVFLVLSLGAYTPLHGLFYALVPGYNKTREAGRDLVITHLSLAILAGFGAQAFLSPFAKSRRREYLGLICTFSGLTLILSFLVFAGYLYRSQVLGQNSDNFDFLFFSCLLLLLASAIALFRYYAVLGRRALKVTIVIVCLVDYHFVISPHIQPKSGFDRKTNFEPWRYFQEDKIIAFLRSQPGSFRVDFRDQKYPRNVGEVYKLETINGHGATAPKDFFDLIRVSNGPASRVADLYNVKYIVTTEHLGLAKVAEEKGTSVYENPDCLPRAWVVTAVQTRRSTEVIPALLNPAFDPRQTALVDEQTPIPTSLPSSQAENISPTLAQVPSGGGPRFVLRGSNRFSIETQTPIAGLLVVSENWYPGWRAKVNGKTESVERVDGALMGVYLNPGTAQVDFVYRPTGFYWQLAVTMLAVFTLCCLGVLAGLQNVKTSL